MSKTTKRPIAELKRIPENQLSPEEKLELFGPGNSGVMLYREVERDGKRLIVSREFKSVDDAPDGWEHSPAVFGLETEPQAGPQGTDEFEAVIGAVPAAKPAPAAKAKK